MLDSFTNIIQSINIIGMNSFTDIYKLCFVKNVAIIFTKTIILH